MSAKTVNGCLRDKQAAAPEFLCEFDLSRTILMSGEPDPH